MSKYATTCPHCKKELFIDLTLTSSPSDEETPEAKPQKTLPVRDLEAVLADELGELLEVTPTEGKLIIQSTTWLDKADWNKANKLIKTAGGVWIPGGKESHWEVPV
jgi:hypothetical protein